MVVRRILILAVLAVVAQGPLEAQQGQNQAQYGVAVNAFKSYVSLIAAPLAGPGHKREDLARLNEARDLAASPQIGALVGADLQSSLLRSLDEIRTIVNNAREGEDYRAAVQAKAREAARASEQIRERLNKLNASGQDVCTNICRLRYDDQNWEPFDDFGHGPPGTTPSPAPTSTTPSPSGPRPGPTPQADGPITLVGVDTPSPATGGPTTATTGRTTPPETPAGPGDTRTAGQPIPTQPGNLPGEPQVVLRQDQIQQLAALLVPLLGGQAGQGSPQIFVDGSSGGNSITIRILPGSGPAVPTGPVVAPRGETTITLPPGPVEVTRPLPPPATDVQTERDQRIAEQQQWLHEFNGQLQWFYQPGQAGYQSLFNVIQRPDGSFRAYVIQQNHDRLSRAAAQIVAGPLGAVYPREVQAIERYLLSIARRDVLGYDRAQLQQTVAAQLQQDAEGLRALIENLNRQIERMPPA